MTKWIISTISSTGYFGIFLLMIIENVFPPIPSELIMPLAGYLATRNEFSLIGVILSGTLGAVAGSLPLYYLGAKLSKDHLKNLLQKHGRWVMLYPEDVDKADKWFNRHGGKAVFFCRLLPGIRSLISIPAGFNQMKLPRFLLFSFLGSSIWTSMLVFAGYFLGTNFQEVEKYLDPFVYLFLGVILFLYLRRLSNSGNRSRNERRN